MEKKKEWMFYVARPMAVIVKGTKKQAVEARKRILEIPNLDGEYVTLFSHIPNVDRAMYTDDSVEEISPKAIEEYN